MHQAPLSLLFDDWIPARRASGASQLVSPLVLLAGGGNDDPFAALDWPRPDFNIGCLELLIGLMTTILRPSDMGGWWDLWQSPPTIEQLRQAAAPAAAAFVLDGPGARFLQDRDELSGESLPVERLLIDAPGQNTVEKNTDLLVKRDRFPVLCRPAAAMALFVLQAFAPSGGAGHRTSMRGGGPLTTLVLPGRGPDGRPPLFWHQIWANVTVGQPPAAKDYPRIFPWLEPTRRSDAGGTGATSLDGNQAHALQAFWGMPRRIRLQFRPAQPDEVCSLTGLPDAVFVTGFVTRPGGVQYVNAASLHPLTPTYTPKPGDAPLPVHPQPGGIGYRHWHALVAKDGARAQPAQAVADYIVLVAYEDAEARLLVGGYDMDNMKARGFVEARMPLFVLPEPKAQAMLLARARALAEGATEAGNLLRMQVRIATSEAAKPDATLPGSVRQSFFESTAADFWGLMRRIRDALMQDARFDSESLAREWLAVLRKQALRLFDEAAPLDPLSPDAAGRLKDGKWMAPTVVTARRMLTLGLAGYGKLGAALFETLGLPAVQPAKRSKKAKANT